MRPPERATSTVGFVGIGRIGASMAERLLERGTALTIWNRTESKIASLGTKGASTASTPAELVDRCDIVITCLHGPDSDRQVYLGPDGLLDGAVPGTIFVNTATCGLEWIRQLETEVTKSGGQLVDSPILGAGPPSARAGQLVFPVGGPEPVIQRVMPLLLTMAAKVEHVGPVGMGQVVKLVNNMQVAIAATALAQGIRIASAAGLEPRALAELLPLGSSHSRAMDLWLAAMADRDHPENGSLRTLGKDLALALEMASLVGEQSCVAHASAQVFELGQHSDWATSAVSALVELAGPSPGSWP